MTHLRLIPLVAIAAAIACSSPTSSRSSALNCNVPGLGHYALALIVTARDAPTLDHLASGVSGSYVTGPYADTLAYVSEGNATLDGFGPPGSYTLTLRHAGYATLDTTVAVASGDCGDSVPLVVIADMQPAP